MNEDQIKHMVDRFLGWKLPSSFTPDNGISFERFGNKGTPHQYAHQPIGTNLFDATQADAMVRYMVKGMPEFQWREVPLDALVAALRDIISIAKDDGAIRHWLVAIRALGDIVKRAEEELGKLQGSK